MNIANQPWHWESGEQREWTMEKLEKINRIHKQWVQSATNFVPSMFALLSGCVEIFQLRKIGKLPCQSQYQAQRMELKIMLLNLKSSINYSLNMDGVCCSNNVWLSLFAQRSASRAVLASLISSYHIFVVLCEKALYVWREERIKYILKKCKDAFDGFIEWIIYVNFRCFQCIAKWMWVKFLMDTQNSMVSVSAYGKSVECCNLCENLTEDSQEWTL